jgi:hypothetical protein
MLTIKISDNPVDIPTDFSFSMNLKSPIFYDLGSTSYPFKLPATPRNNIAFGFRNRIANTNSVYNEFNGSVYWNGILLFSGTTKIKLANSEYFEGYLLEGSGDFNYKRKADTMQDIDYGEISFDDDNQRYNYIKSCIDKVYPERVVGFPRIKNKQYMTTEPTDPDLHYFNQYYYSNLIYYWTLQNNRPLVVPMVYFKHVLAKLFEHLKFSLTDEFFAKDPVFNSLMLYNSVNCNRDNEYGDPQSSFFSYDLSKLVYNYHVPRMTVNDFITAMESFFNVRLFINTTTKTARIVSVDEIIRSKYLYTLPSRVISISTEPQTEISGFNLKMTMRTSDELYNYFKLQETDFLGRFKTPVERFENLNPWPRSDYFDIRWVNQEGKYYGLTVENGWRPLSDQFFTYYGKFTYIFKNSNESISTRASTLMHDVNDDNNVVIGSSMSDWKNVGMILFFKDFMNTPAEHQKAVGRNSLGSQSLLFGGESGLINNHYKAFLDFRMSTKMVKITIQLGVSELKEFDFSKKYIINGMPYLVGSVLVTIKRDRIMPATLECYPCP